MKVQQCLYTGTNEQAEEGPEGQTYSTYSAIRLVSPLSRMNTNNKIMQSYEIIVTIQVLPFPNNPKDLDNPSYKMDLDFWDCLGRKKHHLINEEIWYTLTQTTKQ